MKYILAALFSLTATWAVSVSAANDSCKKISALARQAMAARQGGELLEDSLDKIGDGSKFASNMIMRAYERPIEVMEILRKQAVTEFQNEAFRECLNANS